MIAFRIISFSFFAVCTVVHLVRRKHAGFTKSLIPLSIMLCYFSIAETIPPIKIIAAAASFIGDVLLLKPCIKWFTAGRLFFMLSHLTYGLSFVPKIKFHSLSLPLIIAVAIAYCVVSASTVIIVGKTAPKRTAPLLFIYLLTNAFMNILALMNMLSNLNPFGITIYVGALLFFISDNFLFIEEFHENKPDFFTTIVSTYIIGEFLIAIGSALL